MALFAQIARFPVRFGLSRPTAGWALVLVVAGLVSFARCDLPLQEPQESRYGEIPREMLAAGDWVVPRLHGQPYFDKPPLLYWLVMVSYRCFGTTDAAARLVPCTALFLGVVVSYAWGQRTVGPCAALAGVLILCLSCRAVQLARLLNMDGLLTLTVVAAWAAGHTALRAGRLRWDWWLVAAGVTGLGVLAKGPVALVLVLGPLALWSWWDRSSVRLTPTNGAVFVAVSLGLAAPWFVAVEARAPGFLQSFFWTHHVQRYLTPFDHEEPWWFYLPEVALALFPATLLVPRLIGRLVADKGRSEVVLFLIAALFCLGFFSIAGCKRPMYVLPALPPMALGLGWGVVGGCVSGREQVPRAACPPVVRAFITTDTSLGSRGMPRADKPPVAPPCSRTLLVLASLTFAVLLGFLVFVQPMYAEKYSLRTLVRRCAEVRGDRPVVCYPRPWDSVSLYLRDDVPAYGADRLAELATRLTTATETLVFVKAGQSETDLRAALPVGRSFVVLGLQGGVVLGRVSARGKEESP